MNNLKSLIVAIGATLSAVQYAHAINLSEYDIDPRFRAKLVKEKAKQGVTRAKFANLGDDEEGQEGCGNQSIGNVNTGGRPGAAPREVFVFAPNAINMVSGRGCK